MRAKRPLLVAGHGIRLAGAMDELNDVLSMFQIPVVTTFNGFDLIPSDHHCFVGRVGTVGTYGGINALSRCDVLIEVGTRNNIRQVSYSPQSFAPQARRVVVDIDGSELEKPGVTASDKIQVDAKTFLRQLMDERFTDMCPGWLSSLRDFSASSPQEQSPPYIFIRQLTESLPEGAVVVCGNGTACVCMFQAGIVKRGQRIFWNSGTAAMGYDLPAAIGAYFGTGKEIVCITGDGSLQMNIQELQTIKHHNIPVKIFVLNNSGYHSIRMTQDKYFGGNHIGCDAMSGISFPDLSRVAYAYDIQYCKDVQTALRMDGACICEVMIGSEYVFSPKWTGGFNVR